LLRLFRFVFDFVFCVEVCLQWLIIGLFGIGCRSYTVRPRITQPSYVLKQLRSVYHRDSRFFLLLQRITIKDAEVRFIRCEKSRISTALGMHKMKEPLPN